MAIVYVMTQLEDNNLCIINVYVTMSLVFSGLTMGTERFLFC